MTPFTPDKVKTSLDEILIDAAQPDLYCINAFRVLELPVDCNEMDINRRQKIIEISTKNKSPLPIGPGRALPLPNPPDSYACTNAVERLHDPERRFVDEFFWFWPHELGNSKEDEALVSLRSGDDEQAVQVWTDYANNYSVENVSVHNLAVLAHIMALDLELSLNGSTPNESQSNRLEIYWKQALKRYQGLTKVNSFWQRLELRVKDYDDPHLDSTTVANLRASLPLGLLMINSRLAVQAAERGDKVCAQRHLKVMNTSGFNERFVTDALMRSTEPARKRIKSYCKSVEERINSDPVHADKVVLELLDTSQPVLNLLGMLLPQDSPTLSGLRDEIALSGLSGMISFGNKTEIWETCAKIVKRLLDIAASPSARSRIQENLNTLEGNLQAGNNFYGPGYYDLPSAVLEQAERARKQLEANNFDSAINILETLLDPNRTTLAEHYRPVIRKALAYTLNARGQERIRVAAAELDKPRTVLEKIKQRERGNDPNLFMTMLAVQSGTEQSAVQSRELYCMACGNLIYSRWFTFTAKEVKYLICETCNSNDDREMESRRSGFGSALQLANSDLLYAQELDPKNQTVDENLKALRSLSSQVGVSLPNRRTTSAPAPKPKPTKPAAPKPIPTTPKPAPARTSITPKPAPARSATASKPAPKSNPRRRYWADNAGVKRHFFAFLFDLLFIGIIEYVFLYISAEQFIWDNGALVVTASQGTSSLLNIVIIAIIPAYYLLFHGFLGRRTLGERITRSEVLTLKYETPPFLLRTWRIAVFCGMLALGYYISPWFYLIFLFPMLNEKRRGLQDFLSATYLSIVD